MIEVQKNNGLISKFTVTACTEVLKTKKAQEMLNAILENTSEHKLFVAPVSPSETAGRCKEGGV